SFHLAVMTVLFFALRMRVVWRERALDRQILLPRIGALAGGALMGAAVGAVWIIPFLELLHNSAETAQRGNLAPKLGMGALGNVFVPAFWGRGSGTTTGLGLTLNRYIYAGALPVMLAGGALLVRRVFQRRAIAIFGTVCLAVALGVPVIFGAVRLLPGFHQADNRRLSVLFLLCVALLAGFGLDDLAARRPEGARRRRLLTFALGFAAVSLLWVFLVHPSPSSFGGILKTAWRFGGPPGGELV